MRAHPDNALVLIDEPHDVHDDERRMLEARADRLADFTPAGAHAWPLPSVVCPGPAGTPLSTARGAAPSSSIAAPAGTDDMVHVTIDSFVRTTPIDPTVCHLIGDDQHIMCGAATGFAIQASTLPHPQTSPCAGGCGRARCGACAAEQRGGG